MQPHLQAWHDLVETGAFAGPAGTSTSGDQHILKGGLWWYKKFCPQIPKRWTHGVIKCETTRGREKQLTGSHLSGDWLFCWSQSWHWWSYVSEQLKGDLRGPPSQVNLQRDMLPYTGSSTDIYPHSSLGLPMELFLKAPVADHHHLLWSDSHTLTWVPLVKFKMPYFTETWQMNQKAGLCTLHVTNKRTCFEDETKFCRTTVNPENHWPLLFLLIFSCSFLKCWLIFFCWAKISKWAGTFPILGQCVYKGWGLLVSWPRFLLLCIDPIKHYHLRFVRVLFFNVAIWFIAEYNSIMFSKRFLDLSPSSLL